MNENIFTVALLTSAASFPLLTMAKRKGNADTNHKLPNVIVI